VDLKKTHKKKSCFYLYLSVGGNRRHGDGRDERDHVAKGDDGQTFNDASLTNDPSQSKSAIQCFNGLFFPGILNLLF